MKDYQTWSFSKEELADVVQYTYRRLYDINKTLPEDKKLFVPSDEDPKKCDLTTFVQNWTDYNLTRDASKIRDLDQIRAKHEEVKTEKTQLQVDKLKGRLVDVNDVKKLWANVANTVMQNMIHLPHKLAPMLKMMENTEEIALIIDEEIRKILNDIAEAPLPEEAEEETEREDDEE